MARKPRVEFAGAFYHVICRGNQRQVIFRGDGDRKYYLERLEEYRQRYGFNVYAYVLMSNDFFKKALTSFIESLSRQGRENRLLHRSTTETFCRIRAKNKRIALKDVLKRELKNSEFGFYFEREKIYRRNCKISSGREAAVDK